MIQDIQEAYRSFGTSLHEAVSCMNSPGEALDIGDRMMAVYGSFGSEAFGGTNTNRQ